MNENILHIFSDVYSTSDHLLPVYVDEEELNRVFNEEMTPCLSETNVRTYDESPIKFDDQVDQRNCFPKNQADLLEARDSKK